MLAEIPANWSRKNEARSVFQITKKIPKIKKYFIDAFFWVMFGFLGMISSKSRITTEIINKIENHEC